VKQIIQSPRTGKLELATTAEHHPAAVDGLAGYLEVLGGRERRQD